MDRKNPGGREKWVTGGSKGTFKRGSGLGTGPAGFGSRPGGPSGSFGGGSGSGGKRSGGGMNPLMIILALVVMLLGGGGAGLSSLLGGSGSDSAYEQSYAPAQQTQQNYSQQTQNNTGYNKPAQSVFQNYASAWSDQSGNKGSLNREVAPGSRDKYTKLKGDGKDEVTLMIYMCGTDLESRSGMATNDLKEMASANIADNVNVIIHTGGCREWKVRGISNSVNQIYKMENGGLSCLEKNAGKDSMVKPETLTSFIKYCTKNYPADRYQLIMWDHGGGSLTGYGYDELNKSAGSMTLAGIDKALGKAGVKFDFIGFDACLMGTVENGLMLDKYADYLIASEETEPGYGWYYTNWLSALSRNTSISTLDLGKQIIDDFVKDNTNKRQGSSITLSLVDLAELSNTVPEKLSAFAKSTSDMIRGDEFAKVSKARVNTREFAQSSKIDQVDLVHLAENVGTPEALALAKVLKSAVKYNQTASSMTNAYGISIYFPYKKTSKVDSAVRTYEAIGMDDEYAKCIKDFATFEVTGQAAAGGTQNPYTSLFGGQGAGTGNASGGSTYSGSGSGTYSGGSLAGSGSSQEMVLALLEAMMSGSYRSIDGLDRSNVDFIDMDVAQTAAEQFAAHHLNPEDLKWTQTSAGRRLKLTDEQWDMIETLALNCFYDDGEGYIDLGLDNVYEFDENYDLIGDYDHTWLAIDGQPVAYYFMDEVHEADKYTIRGYVPAYLNGERVNLILVFDDENPHGYIRGASMVYDRDVTEVQAKELMEVGAGDKLDFICDYYTYDGQYQDSFFLGDEMTLGETVMISNVDVGSGDTIVSYKLTDCYNNFYWTEQF